MNDESRVINLERHKEALAKGAALIADLDPLLQNVGDRIADFVELIGKHDFRTQDGTVAVTNQREAAMLAFCLVELAAFRTEHLNYTAMDIEVPE